MANRCWDSDIETVKILIAAQKFASPISNISPKHLSNCFSTSFVCLSGLLNSFESKTNILAYQLTSVLIFFKFSLCLSEIRGTF